MGPVCCPETSVINYHYSLRNIPEESSSSPVLLDLQRAIELFKDVCNIINRKNDNYKYTYSTQSGEQYL